jgi:vacuolar-type H+-ATPase catalytic subunit A/Vma1
VPTSFDNAGQLVYTKQNLDIMQTATYYVRGVYSKRIDKNTQFRFNAAVSSVGQHRIMNEILWSF